MSRLSNAKDADRESATISSTSSRPDAMAPATVRYPPNVTISPNARYARLAAIALPAKRCATGFHRGLRITTQPMVRARRTSACQTGPGGRRQSQAATSPAASTKPTPIRALTMRDANGTRRPIVSRRSVDAVSAPTQTANTARSMDPGCPVAAHANHRAPSMRRQDARRVRSDQAAEALALEAAHPSYAIPQASFHEPCSRLYLSRPPPKQPKGPGSSQVYRKDAVFGVHPIGARTHKAPAWARR